MMNSDDNQLLKDSGENVISPSKKRRRVSVDNNENNSSIEEDEMDLHQPSNKEMKKNEYGSHQSNLCEFEDEHHPRHGDEIDCDNSLLLSRGSTPHAPLHPTQRLTGTLGAKVDTFTVPKQGDVMDDDFPYEQIDRADSFDEITLKQSLERPESSSNVSPAIQHQQEGEDDADGRMEGYAESNEELEPGELNDDDDETNVYVANNDDLAQEKCLNDSLEIPSSSNFGKSHDQGNEADVTRSEMNVNDHPSLRSTIAKSLSEKEKADNLTVVPQPLKSGEFCIDDKEKSIQFNQHAQSAKVHITHQYSQQKQQQQHQALKKKRSQSQINRADDHHHHKHLKSRIFFGCSKLEDYELQKKIGEGTFGEVSGAKHRKTGKFYALKKVLMHNEKEGVPITAMREIKILKSLNHVNIIGLSEISFLRGERSNRERGTLFMVFPYMDHDLAGLLENPTVKLTEAQIKCYMQQLLEGTAYLHKSKILHRDMKASNILIDNAGNLKLADFGLARGYLPEKPDKDYTNCVVTRWYRPPELFLGATKYTAAIDMWGVGCVLGEMYKRRPILPGSSDMHQLELIFGLCGTPNELNWPNHRSLPSFKECAMTFNNRYNKSIDERYKQFNPLAVDLMDKLIQLDPSKRWTAERALEHPYFWKRPFPAKPNTSDFKPFPSSHEYATRKERQEKIELLKHVEGGGHHRALKQPEPHFADQEIMEIGYRTLYGEEYVYQMKKRMLSNYPNQQQHQQQQRYHY